MELQELQVTLSGGARFLLVSEVVGEFSRKEGRQSATYHIWEEIGFRTSPYAVSEDNSRNRVGSVGFGSYPNTDAHSCNRQDRTKGELPVRHRYYWSWLLIS